MVKKKNKIDKLKVVPKKKLIESIKSDKNSLVISPDIININDSLNYNLNTEDGKSIISDFVSLSTIQKKIGGEITETNSFIKEELTKKISIFDKIKNMASTNRKWLIGTPLFILGAYSNFFIMAFLYSALAQYGLNWFINYSTEQVTNESIKKIQENNFKKLNEIILSAEDEKLMNQIKIEISNGNKILYDLITESKFERLLPEIYKNNSSAIIELKNNPNMIIEIINTLT